MVQGGLYIHHYSTSLMSLATYGINLIIYSLIISGLSSTLTSLDTSNPVESGLVQ